MVLNLRLLSAKMRTRSEHFTAVDNFFDQAANDFHWF
jgi:hypothetical protein